MGSTQGSSDAGAVSLGWSRWHTHGSVDGFVEHLKGYLISYFTVLCISKSIIVDWRRLHFLEMMMKDDIQDWILRPVDYAGIFEQSRGFGTE
jgi:hypothetical protein